MVQLAQRIRGGDLRGRRQSRDDRAACRRVGREQCRLQGGHGVQQPQRLQPGQRLRDENQAEQQRSGRRHEREPAPVDSVRDRTPNQAEQHERHDRGRAQHPDGQR